MKHIKLFEEFVNEEKELDIDLVQITFNYLVKNNATYDQQLYLSNADRDAIKDEYGKSLPRGFAGPESYMMSGSILTPLAGDSIYVDGRSLVKGSKTVMKLTGKETWADVAKVLDIK